MASVTKQVFSAVAAAAAAVLIAGCAGAQSNSSSSPAELLCPTGTNLGIVAAHQDDDILFMNPNLQKEIDNGACVHVLFLTAGDAGKNQQYWQGREAGSRAAYAQMQSKPDQWTLNTTALGSKTVAGATFNANLNMTQNYVRLPDGASDGSGFPSDDDQSLLKLWEGKIPSIKSLGPNATSYTKDSLDQLINDFYQTYQVKEVWTQDYVGSFACETTGCGGNDHTDHRVTARLAKQATENYSLPGGITGYQDYAISDLPVNLTKAQTEQKLNTFMAYVPHDPDVCQTRPTCLRSPDYGPWLQRQYEIQLQQASHSASGNS